MKKKTKIKTRYKVLGIISGVFLLVLGTLSGIMIEQSSIDESSTPQVPNITILLTPKAYTSSIKRPHAGAPTLDK